MNTTYKDYSMADLDRIHSFTKNELNDKEKLYLKQPNQKLNTQILQLREIILTIEEEIHSRGESAL